MLFQNSVNTHLAGAAGTFTGGLNYWNHWRQTDIVMMLNGALAGLVAITAEPLTPGPITAMFIDLLELSYVLHKNARKLWFGRCSWCNSSSYVCWNFWNISGSPN